MSTGPYRLRIASGLCLVLLFSILEPDSVRAQGGLEQFRPVERVEERGEIETDRDSFTPATTLVAPSRVMIESAWSVIDNRGSQATHSLPELLVRYGATDWLEVRVGANYEIGGEPSDISTSQGAFTERRRSGGGGHGEEESEIEEEANVNYGVKLDLSDQCRWIPDSALILRGATPVSGEVTTTSFVATYVFGWELENEWVWDTALRYGISGDGEDRVQGWSPSTVIKIPVMSRAKAHLEYFSIFNESGEANTEKHYISPGVHYLITEDFEVGVRVGWGLNQEASNFFSNIGFGWQF